LKKHAKVLIKAMARDYRSPMNIHHLELFYYVAKHGGISDAIRHMPYGTMPISGLCRPELGGRGF
jgi:hypothetical protein